MTVARARRAAAAIVVGAAIVRAPAVGAGFPYFSYVDEGHVVRPAVRMLGERTWDPGVYRYPSLLIEAMAAGALAIDPVYRLATGRPSPAPPLGRMYDVFEPPSVLLAGRLLVLAASVATVALVIGLGRLAAGPAAGLAAGILAAVLPALVCRSAIVIVDTPATCLVTLALYSALRLAAGAGLRFAVLAGAAAGLAATAKYPSGAVLAGVLVVVVLAPVSGRARAGHATLALVAAALAAVAGMPALVLRSEQVISTLHWLQQYYAAKPATVSYARAAFAADELGPLVLPLAVLGCARLLLLPRARSLALGGLVFAAALLVPLLPHTYQPFRNLLPLVPLACVAAGAAIAWGADVGSAPLGLGAGARTRLTVGAACALAGLALVQGVAPFVRLNAHLVDTRVIARRWLEAHAPQGSRLLVAEELAFLPSELARTGARVMVVPRVDLSDVLASESVDLVVTGTLVSEASPVTQAHDRALSGRPVLFEVGTEPTPAGSGYWHGNGQQIRVFGNAPAQG